ncbi:type IV secretion system DNA-binding domain-containing protein, partial [Patescibacteria group bacterium]|nr:type IV secretion system DNA-binding domain-containing protein [Patescibacteria group bacterium]
MGINELIYNFVWISIYLSVLAGVFLGIIYWIVSSRREKVEKAHAFNLTFLHIKMPNDNEIEISAAEELFASLSGIRKAPLQALFSGQHRISFEIVSKREGISFYVVVPDEIASIVEKQINGVYPVAEIDIVNPHEIWDRGDYTKVAELKLAGAPYYPLKMHEDMKADTLNSITSAVSKMGDEEVVTIQYVIQAAGYNWMKAGRRYINQVKLKASNTEKNYNIDTNFLEGIEKKISKPGFNLALRIVSISKDDISAENHIQNVITAFEQVGDVNYNRLIRKSTFFPGRSNKQLIDRFIYRQINVKEIFIPMFEISIYRNIPVLNTVEMATIFHFPNKNVQTPNIVWLKSRRSIAPANIPQAKDGIWLGVSEYRGVKREIHMKEKDRTRHFYIIGQTGTGKSEMLKYMALQDIRNGEGVAVIDPHGTDVRDLLEKIPASRIDDVILFDAADTTRPMGLNMLEAHGEEDKHMVINAFIALLYKLYDPNRQGIMGPQLERSIRNVMLTAMVDPDSTMIDVLRLLIDAKYAQRFIDKLEDPLVKRFWTDEMAKTSDFHKSEKMGYFVSKFDRFVTERLMRNMLGQPKSSFNFADIMANKKILLVDLAKGKIGEENSNFIGLLLVPRILAAALSRHKLIEQGIKDFPSFYLYVDEFQNFATPDFETILSEARKYKLNLVVAHQFVAQLTDEIKEAIFGNVGSMCTFRVGADDAEFLENYFGPTFTSKDISNLPIGNAY